MYTHIRRSYFTLPCKRNIGGQTERDAVHVFVGRDLADPVKLDRVQLEVTTHYLLHALPDIVLWLIALGEAMAMDHRQLRLGFSNLSFATLEKATEGVQEFNGRGWEVHHKVVKRLEAWSSCFHLR